MNNPGTALPISKPRRTWPSFSLRTLVVLFTAFAVWFGIRVNHANHQKSVVQLVEGSGGSIIYDYERNHFAKKRPPPPKMPGPTWLRVLLDKHMFINVEEVDFGDETSSNELSKQLVAVSKLRPHVKVLYLYSTNVSDDDLQIVSQMPNLVYLYLHNTQIGNDGLRHLRKLQCLEGLYADGTQVDERGISHLSRLPNLNELHLQATPVNDEAVPHLKKLSNLKQLLLSGTKMTYGAIDKLETTLPNCLVLAKYLEPLGDPKMDSERLSEVIAFLDRELKNSKDDGKETLRLLYDKASLLERQGMNRDAITAWDEYRESAEPQSFEWLTGTAHIARAFQKLEEYHEAVSFFRQIIETQEDENRITVTEVKWPWSGESGHLILLELAECYFSLEQFADTSDVLEQVARNVEKFKKSPRVKDHFLGEELESASRPLEYKVTSLTERLAD